VLLFVTQLDLHLTQVKERAEKTADSIKHIVELLEELKDDLKNDVGKRKDTTQICGQDKGNLKRVKEEGDDRHQLVDETQCRNKRVRVI
tara:strand:- start:2787 stop:3053 length:267 start_codon:yes stop_codon:yes gene_type:complete